MALSEADWRALCPSAVVRIYPPQAVLVLEGERADTLFVLLDGRVKVYLADEAGKEVVLSTLGPGEFFGELVVDAGLRSASVTSQTRVRLLAIPRPEIEALVMARPDFAVDLMRRLASRIRALTAQVRALALSDVYGRLARLLTELSTEDREGRIVSGKLTQQEIANRIGASREMVNRLLRDLAGAGYVTVTRDAIRIHRALPLKW